MKATTTTTNKNSPAYLRGFRAWAAQPGNPYHENDMRNADFVAGQRDGFAANQEYLRELDREDRAQFYFEE